MTLRIVLLLFIGILSSSLADKAGGHHHHEHHHEHHHHPHTDPASDSLSVPVATSYSAAVQPSITSGYSSAPKVSSKSSSTVVVKTVSSEKAKVVPAASSPSGSVDKAEDRVDKVEEKSDSYAAPAPAASYSAPAPAPAVSTGNLYYYYPVAAYPIHGNGGSPHPSHGIKPSSHYGPPRKSGYAPHRDSSGGHSSASGGTDLNDNGFGIFFLLVPLAILLLAVPFFALNGVNVNNNNGRSFSPEFYRSSELDEKFGSFAELQTEIDLLLGKYVAALDSEQCMDRIVCELGVKASNIPSKGLLFRYAG